MTAYFFAIIENIQIIAYITLSVLIGILIINYVATPEEPYTECDKTKIKKFKSINLKIYLSLPFLCLILIIPSSSDLVKVRLNLIKYELTSPENINKGINFIEELSKKLECKYLGCSKDDSKQQHN